jgi:hypothetical protein
MFGDTCTDGFSTMCRTYIYRVYNGRRASLVAMLVMILGLLSAGQSPSQAAQVSLAWDAPTTCLDGTPLTNLVGYCVYFGRTDGSYTNRIVTGPASSATVTGLLDGVTYHFVVTASNSKAEESPFSNAIAWNSTDTDVDGLPDAWESRFFGDIAVEDSVPSADADADGIDNLNEYIAGSNPTDPASFCRLTLLMTDGQPNVSFVATRAAGGGYEGKLRYYTLEQSTIPEPGIWSAVFGKANILGQDQSVSQTIGSEAADTCYRLRAWLQ